MKVNPEKGEAARLLAPVKMEAAALVIGAPFYALVVVLLLEGPLKLGALALYGAGAGGWILLRARRALRGGPPSSPERP